MTGASGRIPPQSAVVIRVSEGQYLTVVDVEGEQVSDLVAFDPTGEEWLSSGRSIDYASTLFFTTGHILYSNRSSAMLSIVDDTVRRHDFLFAPCSPEMF